MSIELGLGVGVGNTCGLVEQVLEPFWFVVDFGKQAPTERRWGIQVGRGLGESTMSISLESRSEAGTSESRAKGGQSVGAMVFPKLARRMGRSLDVGEGASRVGWDAPYSWSTIIPSRRRQESIEGVLIGCAIGEGLARLPWRRRLGLGAYRGVLRPGSRTDEMIITIQSLLLSQSATENFCRNLEKRMVWYGRSWPLSWMVRGVGGLVCGLFGRGNKGAFPGSDPLVRAMVLSVVMQGHHEGILRWVHKSTQMSDRWGEVSQAAFLVATAAQCAQFHQTAYAVGPEEMMESLSGAAESRDLRLQLEGLGRGITGGLSIREMVKGMGCEGRWRDDSVGNALLGVYTYARHLGDLRGGMEELLGIPGDLRGVASVFGGLGAIHGGVSGIPGDWRGALSLYPYGEEWVQGYVDRCLDWPHGPDDIQETMPLPSYPVGQLIRNFSRLFR